MDDEMRTRIQAKIDSLQPGDTFDLKTLMGEDWLVIPSKQDFGRQFKKLLSSGLIVRVSHDHLANSPRRDIYCRLEP